MLISRFNFRFVWLIAPMIRAFRSVITNEFLNIFPLQYHIRLTEFSILFLKTFPASIGIGWGDYCLQAAFSGVINARSTKTTCSWSFWTTSTFQNAQFSVNIFSCASLSQIIYSIVIESSGVKVPIVKYWPLRMFSKNWQ